MPPHTNTRLVVAGPTLVLNGRSHAAPSCANAVLDTSTAIAHRTDNTVVHISDVLEQLHTDGAGYPSIYKAIRQLTDASRQTGLQQPCNDSTATG